MQASKKEENFPGLKTGQNLIGVIFVLALVCSGLLGIAFKRTYQLVVRRDNLSRQRRIFTGFYSLVWATLALTVALYSFLTAQFFNQI